SPIPNRESPIQESSNRRIPEMKHAVRISGWLAFAVLFAAGITLQLQFNVRLESDGVFHFAWLRSLLGLVYRLLGAWFCYRLTSRFYGAGLAAMATTSVFMGSFMLWYMVKEP